MTNQRVTYDVIIVGGGPAGLSAALILARCRRRVLLIDAQQPRNAAAQGVHGFLTRDGIAPEELRRLGREELARYDSVTFLCGTVLKAEALDERFSVELADGACHTSRMLLLATGVKDEIPALEGIDALYGKSVFHCPYCDGWEVRDKALAAYKKGAENSTFALQLLVWSQDVVLVTDGPAALPKKERRLLDAHGIALYEHKIRRLEGSDGQLRQIVFADESSIAREAMFFSTGFSQCSDIAHELGCDFTEQPVVDTGRRQTTNIPGLFVAGDAAREAQLAIIAAAEGAKAAFTINDELARADARGVLS